MIPSALEQLPNTYRAFFGNFPYLTPAQKALIQPILHRQDVILQAGTGLGKTEAVLAPATERLMTHQGYFTILYVVPTRALALDMYRRIQPIYKKLGLKCGIRTGDGKTLRDAKPSLLILTPESLDVLLGSQNGENKYFLKHAHILIIDEIHIFMGTERGSQLSYLQKRLELQLNNTLQILTLSATIAEPQDIIVWFHLKNVFYYQQPGNRKLIPYWVHIADEGAELVSFFDDLSSYWKCKKILVFANSRQKCEKLFNILNYEGIFSGNVFLHYSNLSTKERRFVESSFRASKQSLCIATSTLEVGIDIGDIDGVVLIGPPASTMAFLQRIGRGNRRQNHLKFWGVCYGVDAERQLLQFLALFEQASGNTLERRSLPNHYSVLFQQILSCLYAKGVISHNLLKRLFDTTEVFSIIERMVAKSWLQPGSYPNNLKNQDLDCVKTQGLVAAKRFNSANINSLTINQSRKLSHQSKPDSSDCLGIRLELFSGGWRYKVALQRQQIWSNFPPADEEYEVILGTEVIAALPLSVIKQLAIGDIFRFVGKTLKLLKIEEKKASREIFVQEVDDLQPKDLCWYGPGIPISFEVAQAVKSILLGDCQPKGLLNRTQRLLNSLQSRSYIQGLNGLYVHRLDSGFYRYETFLGTTGNFILYHQIQYQLSATTGGLFVHFDEMGIESNVWISFQNLTLPYSNPLFKEWIDCHLARLRSAFLWNNWLFSLPEELQKKEIYSILLDSRVLEHFKKYQSEAMPVPPQ